MPHPHARLTPRARLELVQEVAAGFSQAEVARRFRVSRHTVAKWVRRFRRHGAAGSRTAARPRVATRDARRPCSSAASARCAAARDWARIASPGRSASPAPPVRRAQACGAQSPGPPASREQGDRALRAPRARRPAPSRREAPGQDPRRRPAARARPREHHAARAWRRARLPARRLDDHSRYAHVEALPTSAERAVPPSSSAPSPRSAGAAPTCARCSPTTRGPTTRAPSARSPMLTPSASSARSLTAHRRTARRSASSASCRTSGLTLAPTAPTPTARGSCRAGSIATITADRTAASTGPSSDPACEQRPWAIQLAPAPLPPGRTPRRARTHPT